MSAYITATILCPCDIDDRRVSPFSEPSTTGSSCVSSLATTSCLIYPRLRSGQSFTLACDQVSRLPSLAIRSVVYPRLRSGQSFTLACDQVSRLTSLAIRSVVYPRLRSGQSFTLACDQVSRLSHVSFVVAVI